ncbi:MAG: hypothetical protein K5924_08780 [Chloroflexi bacterium]|nr:hypothetical protein [Chloroflexota bacterium]
MKYTVESWVGGSIYLDVKIANTGGTLSGPIKFQIGGIMDYADLNGCIPICTVNEFWGDYYTEFDSGVAPGTTATFKVELIATKVGVADWTVMIYEDTRDFYFGSAKTVIR